MEMMKKFEEVPIMTISILVISHFVIHLYTWYFGEAIHFFFRQNLKQFAGTCPILEGKNDSDRVRKKFLYSFVEKLIDNWSSVDDWTWRGLPDQI